MPPIESKQLKASFGKGALKGDSNFFEYKKQSFRLQIISTKYFENTSWGYSCNWWDQIHQRTHMGTCCWPATARVARLNHAALSLTVLCLSCENNPILLDTLQLEEQEQLAKKRELQKSKLS